MDLMRPNDVKRTYSLSNLTVEKFLAENLPFRWARARIHYSNWKVTSSDRRWPFSDDQNRCRVIATFTPVGKVRIALDVS